MKYTTTVIIGAGQSGLAFSKHLSHRSIDHVLIERGEVANSWAKERWDSLRLLTPNWQSRLPGHAYNGNDPDGYMNMAEVVRFLQGYADSTGAPVQDNTKVISVRPLAREVQASGRQVTLAVGEHVRLPRLYRGRDIKWWMDAIGMMDMRHDEVDDIRRARRLPSLQLVGTPEHMTLDLNALRGMGIEIVGRLSGLCDGKAQFSGALGNQCALADLKMNRLLDSIDQWVTANGVAAEFDAAHRFAPTAISAEPRLNMTLADAGIKTVLWATGYRPDYSWLHVPVLDRKGRIRHDGGVVNAPGMYVMGLPFLRRRKSSFIDGAGDDARDLVEHLNSGLHRAAA